MTTLSESNTVYILYDNECPFCRHYCQSVRVHNSAGPLELVTAREPSTLMDEMTAKGLDIDRGMVVKIGNDIYDGPDALHILARLTAQSGVFNRITHCLFRSKKMTSALYPLLRNSRNLVLWLRGISMVKNLEKF